MHCTGPGVWRHHPSDWRGVSAGVNTTSCPRFLTKYDRYSRPEAHKLGCCFKPPQQRWLAQHRYEPCDNRTLGASSLLRALSGKSMALIGDSVTAQLWEVRHRD